MRIIAVLKRMLPLYAVVLVGVELVVFAVYRSFGPARVEMELTIAAFVATAVGLPVIAYVSVKSERLVAMGRELVSLSRIDLMTQLLNRHAFLQDLDDLLASTPAGISAGVFAYIDADHFKSLNDRYGHAFGDEVIGFVADRIRADTRDGDLCARLGGEEFGVFLKGATVDDAAQIAERLRGEIAQTGEEFGIAGLQLTISIGLAAHRPGDDAHATMRNADRSLYAAKNGGRNAVVIELQRYRVA